MHKIEQFILTTVRLILTVLVFWLLVLPQSSDALALASHVASAGRLVNLSATFLHIAWSQIARGVPSFQNWWVCHAWLSSLCSPHLPADPVAHLTPVVLSLCFILLSICPISSNMAPRRYLEASVASRLCASSSTSAIGNVDCSHTRKTATV